ncbi:GIY-YIG nuclease family protein [Gordonia cholesterolivorans]|uniref:GIY-YIG domain-containing protein n=1 Tax=Gordonia cholesterolivorans TaxID=559625 RepID=A0ABN3HDH7_9ACTN
MGSQGVATYNEPDDGFTVPDRSALPTAFVQGFRKLLDQALRTKVPGQKKSIGASAGIYAFYDYDDEPIYVGQTVETLGTRVGRHMRGQRTDTVAYHVLDPMEVATLHLYPAEHLRPAKGDSDEVKAQKKAAVNAMEYSVYYHAIRESKYGSILNEKIPQPTPVMTPEELGEPYKFNLIPEGMREVRSHPDTRIARRAHTLAQLAGVCEDRGEVTEGLRRVIVVQAVRLADLASARLAYAEGRARPSRDIFAATKLVGNILEEFDRKKATGESDDDDD